MCAVGWRVVLSYFAAASLPRNSFLAPADRLGFCSFSCLFCVFLLGGTWQIQRPIDRPTRSRPTDRPTHLHGRRAKQLEMLLAMQSNNIHLQKWFDLHPMWASNPLSPPPSIQSLTSFPPKPRSTPLFPTSVSHPHGHATAVT